MADSTHRRGLHGAARPSSAPPHAFLCALMLLLALALVLVMGGGCTSVTDRADRAFEAGNYDEAYRLYQQAIEEGAKEPEVFQKAARASIHVGNFSAAERLFSNALRHGGGRDAARELASFYVRTSNYASAVRVYQFLLHEESDPQPVYNNLGTALMYAGSPFDAESYLMVAQQLDPSDPLPYLNLGVLYDEHLRQPWLAMGFYRCFLELGGPRQERAKVRQRFDELGARWERQYDPEIVRCGESYRPAKDVPVDLRAQFGGDSPVSGSDISAAVGQEPGPQKNGDSGEARERIVIERQITEPVDGPVDGPGSTAPGARPGGPSAPSDAKPDASSSAREQAMRAFEAGDHAAVVARLGELSLASLDAADMRRLGIALVELGRAGEAASWLEMSLSRDDAPEAVRALIKALDRSGQTARVVAICRKYNGRKGYRDAVAACPASVSPEVLDGKIVVPR